MPGRASQIGPWRGGLAGALILPAFGLAAVLAADALAQDQSSPLELGNSTPSQSQAAFAPIGSATNPPAAVAYSPRDDQGGWTSGEFASANPNLPTLVVAGDSTAATGDPAHRGWGAVLVDYFDTNKVNLVNRARGGRSFRTFLGEGAWQQIVDALKPGDWVVIEFGHNDGGSVTSAQGRADLPGIGDETQDVTNQTGKVETVHPYGWYLRKFIRDAKQKGAIPIVSSTTVRNIWTGGKVERGLGHMLEWARQVADQEKVPFLDHCNITADRYERMSQAKVAAFFPADHTHTSTEGARKNAETLIAGLKALPNLPLVNFLNDQGKAIAAYKPAAPPAQ